MADSSKNATTRSSATVETPRSFSHVFDIELTPATLALATPGEAIKSSSFGCKEYGTWFVKVYLGGDNESSKEHVSIFLMLKEGGSCFPAPAGGGADDVSFSLSACSRKRVSCSLKNITVLSGEGWIKFASHETVSSWLRQHGNRMEVKATIQPIGRLIVTSKQTVAPGGVCLSTPAPVMTGQLRALLSSGKHADCMLVCAGGEHLQAHRVLLSLRSPVFAALFFSSSSDPAGAGGSGGGALFAAPDLSAVPVPEEIEPSVMRKLLEHLYTDEEVDFSDADEARSPQHHHTTMLKTIRCRLAPRRQIDRARAAHVLQHFPTLVGPQQQPAASRPI